MDSKELSLFGGDKKWNAVDWSASDDRVRGGKSQSCIECSAENPVARFYGNLDIQTLGGAGFASQRTRNENEWDLSAYDGIQLTVQKSDSKHYTFNIKDTILERDPSTGREQSTITYEYDFQVPGNATITKKSEVFIPWSSLNATYRGKEKKDAPSLNTASIKQFSIMMRSFFGKQEGAFSLSIDSISAVRLDTKEAMSAIDIKQQNSIPTYNIVNTRSEKNPVDVQAEEASRSVQMSFLSCLTSYTCSHIQPRGAQPQTLTSKFQHLLIFVGFSTIAAFLIRFPVISASIWADFGSCMSKLRTST